MTNDQAELIRPITTNQRRLHENLVEVVRRNQQNHFRKPIADHTRKAFHAVQEIVRQRQQPIILDSGCGTAISTRIIARKYPESFVIGIDRSEVRLSKQYEEQLPENAMTVRADLVDFWLLAVEEKWQLQYHFILYPNPYPKSAHLKRRWHAHPVFPSLLQLGGQLELRTNWQIYAEEFAQALVLSGFSSASARRFMSEEPLTLFEKKYHQAGQALYRINLNLLCLSSDSKD